MKDIEQLFKEKLQHHQVSPPADSWEKLQASWHQQERKSSGGWWWMVASVALLLMLGGLFFLRTDEMQPATRIAVDLPVRPEIDAQPLEAPPAPDSKIESSSNTLAIEASKTGQPDNSSSDTITTEEEDERFAKVNPVVEERLPEPVAKVAVNLPEEMELPVIELSEFSHESVLAHVGDESKPSVTIIYTSGLSQNKEESVETETKNPLEKAAAFLSNIKENGVGFSELRSAKSELLSKAFSSKRDAMPAE